MSVDFTPCRIRSASSAVAAVVPGHDSINKGALLEAKLPHDPDGVVLHTPGESWQHHESHVVGAKEDGEWLNC